jgi:hypothetical protein
LTGSADFGQTDPSQTRQQEYPYRQNIRERITRNYPNPNQEALPAKYHPSPERESSCELFVCHVLFWEECVLQFFVGNFHNASR